MATVKKAGYAVKRRAKNGDFFYTRHWGNGEPAERSQLFASRSGRDKAINKVVASMPGLKKLSEKEWLELQAKKAKKKK